MNKNGSGASGNTEKYWETHLVIKINYDKKLQRD